MFDAIPTSQILKDAFDLNWDDDYIYNSEKTIYKSVKTIARSAHASN